jgi:hypothetical protein
MQATINGETADITKTFSKNIMGITLANAKNTKSTTGRPF